MELEAELAKPARFIEPSAEERARMARRAARKGRKLRKPVAQPQRPADPWRSAALPLPARPRRGRQVITALIVIVILGAAGYGFRQLAGQHLGGLNPVSSGARPSSLPSPTVAEPFLGTPAEHYANGTAGIVIPRAQQVGSYSTVQVAAAYQTAKQMLVAADLNQPTLAGGSPDAFAGLLIPQQRTDFVDGLDKTGVNPQGEQISTRTWVTSFAPGTHLVGDVIKVHGAMEAAATANDGTPVLQVHLDYLFVYPVEHTGQPSTLMRIVQRAAVDVDFGTYTDPGGALQPWWQIVGGGPAGARCDITDGFVHPQFPNASPDKVKPKGTPINPYDQSTPPQNAGACRPVTGT
jgi:hypothetical protein